MKLLLDTHLLLWSAGQPQRLSDVARRLLADADNELLFSAVSFWEIAIKRGKDRSRLAVEPSVLHRNLLDNDYVELPVTSHHTMAVEYLPPIHRDPFDRLLVAQAQHEGLMLLTADPMVSRYPGPVRLV